MYSWADDTSDWLGSADYKFDPKAAVRRAEIAGRAARGGPRTYDHRAEPNPKLVDPTRHIRTESKNPLIVAVDVTGSMASWPFEIFDRLPLLFTTLSQYRPDLEISFAAIGDAGCDRWPLQVTSFASGYDLEQQLKGIYGEGGGGDEPESYGLFAWWAAHHVTLAKGAEPFLIVFGDASMHPTVTRREIGTLLGDDERRDADAIASWQTLARTWNTWFLRRPGGCQGDRVDTQWTRALGRKHVVMLEDEERAVDYAMGIIARTWGRLADFEANMAARQEPAKIEALVAALDAGGVRALHCPDCGAPVPLTAARRFSCTHCRSTLMV